MRRLLISFCAAIIASASFFTAFGQAEESTVQPAKEAATIIRVVDGDTVRVTYGDKKETVKLIGIEVPENRLNKKAKEEAMRSGQNLLTVISTGIDAEIFLKNLVKKGDAVALEFDLQNRDIDGRLLAYVYLPDGKMLNEEILRAGYAELEPNSANLRYREKFTRYYINARDHKRGLWK
jgi:micrococcal nuclease